MLTVQYVKNLKWADSEHKNIECMVKYAEFVEEHPSGICAEDGYAHIQEIWTKANAGEYGPIAEYAPVEAVGTIVQPAQIAMPE